MEKQETLSNNELEFKTVSITDLVPYAGNARTHDDDQIKELIESIKTYGLINPLAVAEKLDEPGKYDVVAGHGRLTALAKMGATDVPVVIHHNLSADEMLRRGAVLADNEVALHAGYDPKALLKELTEIADVRPELIEPAGFNQDYIQNLIPDDLVEGPDNFESSGGFKVTKTIEPFVERGQVFTLGQRKHRVMCGDSSDAIDVEKLMDGKYADLLLTDPPYNVDIGSKGLKRAIKNDKFADEKSFEDFLTEVFGVAKNVLAPHASFYIFYAMSMVVPFVNALRASNLYLRQHLVWVKNSATISWNDYQWQTEPIMYGGNDEDFTNLYHDLAQGIAYGWDSKTTRVWNNSLCQPNAITSDRPSRSKLHPTMKPINLLGYFMKNSSKPLSLVLDLFGGSGSTLICADEIGRQCYTMELDERFASTILLRFAEYTGWTEEIVGEDGKDIRNDLKDWAEKHELSGKNAKK